ncbi:hypothetical protein [Streptomyces sp. NPDC048057]|uniref:hypothetical protein n=1 Tax=Streptomyces sp. NPDC048057 TaxID=3155628 RepID=UPI00340011E7
MTEQEKNTKPLTPEEQEKQDLAQAQTQNIFTDVTRVVGSVFGGNGPHARTDFEGHDLNVMVDLVGNAKPVDLENAGESLRKARDDLKKASRELEAEIGKVQWEGESAEAFREFGKALAAHADGLGAFAGIAGTQITAAGMGLASVRSSMPPRDMRTVKHDVRTMPTPQQVDTNPDFAAAKKVEQDRQEAINQMNRLASYYAVSEQTLANQEAPKFDKILKADVPRPRGRVRLPSNTDRSGVSDSRKANIQPARRYGDEAGPRNERPTEIPGTPPSANVERDPATVIDSVAPPVASPPTNPNSAPPVTPVAPATPPTGPTGSPPVAPISPVGPVTGPVTSKTGGPVPTSPVVSKAHGGPGKTTGAPPITATGQPGVPGRPNITGTPTTATPSANGPVGRPTGPMTAGPSSQGPVGRNGGPGAGGPYTNNQQQMLGRPNTTGGPMQGQPATGRTGGPAGTRQGQGIFGGTPQQRATSSPAGSRVPKGTVIGGEGTGATRATQGRPGQSGVVGANPMGNANRPAGRGTPSVNGVVGAPRQGGSGGNPRPGKSGFTTGGSGLVGGRPGRKRSDKEPEENESTRPDYLTEDEETWTARRRDTTPPVIE